MYCLDLREISSTENFIFFINKLTDKSSFPYNRFYLGSSFCANYFLYCNAYKTIFEYCAEHNLKVSISVPVFTEANLNQGKEKVISLLESGQNIVDEVIINDIGMLRYMANMKKVNLIIGRLFFKNARDCRLDAYYGVSAKVSFLPILSYFPSINISGVELDPIAKKIDLFEFKNFHGTIALNSPFCFVSFGNICKFASIHKPAYEKFRPSALCRLECMDVAEIHIDHRHPEQGKFFRVGKAVFFRQETVEVIGLEQPVNRELFFPIEEYLTYLNMQNEPRINL